MMVWRRGRSTTNWWQMERLQTLIPWLLATLPVSRAQDVPATSMTKGQLPTRTTATTSEYATRDITPTFPSDTTLLTSVVASNSTSAFMNEPTYKPPAELFPSASNDDDDNPRSSNSSVFNYYFLFLLMFGILVATLLWWLRRKKRRRKEQMRLSGQTALARDLEGWSGARRFMPGRYGRSQSAVHTQHEEGLNERGEAPPPYQPKSEDATSHAQDAAASEVEIPLRTVPRDPRERGRLPGYNLPIIVEDRPTSPPVPPHR